MTLRRLASIAALVLALLVSPPALASDQAGTPPVQTPPPAEPAEPAAVSDGDEPSVLVVVAVVAGLVLVAGGLAAVTGRARNRSTAAG